MLLRLPILRLAGADSRFVNGRNPVAAIAAVYRFGDAGEMQDFNLDAEFFFDFALRGHLSPFAEIDLATGQSPGPGFRLAQALDEQQPAFLVAYRCAAAGFGFEVRHVPPNAASAALAISSPHSCTKCPPFGIIIGSGQFRIWLRSACMC